MKKIYLLISFSLAFGPWALFAQSVTFGYTGSAQQYIVPMGCTDSIMVDIRGAQGGGDLTTASGGTGGRVEAVLAVTPGETLMIYVGGEGSKTGTPGWNGGGTGIGGGATSSGGGGGGASDIRSGGTALANRIAVAGGGGGGTDNGGASIGGNGGGLTGATGANGSNPWNCTSLTAATGGSQAAGGLGGASVSCAWNGFNGTLGIGGNSYTNYRCAGGGGGYYGGGGAHNGCAGGGGSSYTNAGASSIIHTQGFQSGNGEITIIPLNGAQVNPSLGADTSVCGSYILDAGTASSWAWSTGDTSQTITVMSAGNYGVTATDANGCTGSDDINITIIAGPTVNLGNDTTACNSLTLDAGNAGASYLWNIGASTQTLVVTATSLYLVTVTDSAGCSSADTIAVTVNPDPVVNLGSDTSACGNIVLDAGGFGGGWTWNTGATTQILNVTSSGTYSVVATSFAGCAGTDSVDIIVNPFPIVSISGLNSNYCDWDDTTTVTGTPAGGTFSGTGMTGNVFDPVAAGAGQYTINYTFTDSAGCSALDSFVVVVSACVSVEAGAAENIRIYPNPNAGTFTIEGLAEGTELEIANMLGQVVYRSVANGPLHVELPEAAQGIYMVRFHQNGEWVAKRIHVK